MSIGKFGNGFIAGFLIAGLLSFCGVVMFTVAGGLDYVEATGFERVVNGMSLEDVRSILGRESGTLNARELVSPDLRRGNNEPPGFFSHVEQSGGIHVLWLSRPGRDLLFSVVSFDNKGRVVGKCSGLDAWFGRKK